MNDKHKNGSLLFLSLGDFNPCSTFAGKMSTPATLNILPCSIICHLKAGTSPPPLAKLIRVNVK